MSKGVLFQNSTAGTTVNSVNPQRYGEVRLCHVA